ncbi:hypothetical protein BCR41DRAFT_400898 [Lobosporangium transversale]|uniref:Uncharacterized protein n=1 Tax=Lobosporangium transversale TaxID=64571 RepID=A0A1Y2G9P2_9FUNG|nr:hypothetical protein BCR41DRAFT_400898 [Lobosporangium transversale]ORZ04882.1 hypothetical protein BCR41DRAFT_400898 [Lobosporangium transversale]|eukprot:XP_021876819.1 hypothetical protein BCR41DRAFT_400898 [Lobosporangium transversale]
MFHFDYLQAYMERRIHEFRDIQNMLLRFTRDQLYQLKELHHLPDSYNTPAGDSFSGMEGNSVIKVNGCHATNTHSGAISSPGVVVDKYKIKTCEQLCDGNDHNGNNNSSSSNHNNNSINNDYSENGNINNDINNKHSIKALGQFLMSTYAVS